ncbi:transposase [Dactylosporangium sp. NPDC000555]|uniref:transposase n=1 Tax=Dactylosporangium sp. NPDC000555 TaxID=3154260 RepID=UPI00332A8DFC
MVAHSLVRPSFVPDAPIRRLRDLTRRRTGVLLRERAREKQRTQKLLEDAGVKLPTVATDIFGVSGTHRLPTTAHLTSWAGLCPGNNKTGSKPKPAPTRPTNTWLKSSRGTAAPAPATPTPSTATSPPAAATNAP